MVRHTWRFEIVLSSETIQKTEEAKVAIVEGLHTKAFTVEWLRELLLGPTTQGGKLR